MRTAAIAIGVAGLLWPLASRAGNGVKPRTPMVWEDPPCMTLVDRSVDAQLHIPYAIPFEDPAEGESITPDEVAGSRTHQFFAFAREPDQVESIPAWINALDVEAALAKGLVEDGVGDDEILETASAWTDAWTRITPDDPRRPIDLETAAGGVDWDTSALPVGVYHIEGYTYEPQFNLWTPRAGVIKVHDGDPDAAGPAIALDQVELVLYRNGSEILTGCIDAPEGTTVEGQWSTVHPSTPLSWQSFGAATIDGASLQIELPAPADPDGMFMAVRLVATSPAGDAYVTHMRDLATLLTSDDPNACDDGGSFVGQPGCGDSSSSGDASGDGSTGSDGGSSSATGTPEATGESGGCRLGGTRPPAITIAAGLLLWVTRRRRGILSY